jgi:hypothetical protein
MAADRVREEAEKLVAVALAALSSATRGLGGSGFATGSAECCVCPVCRTIAAMRDPNSDLAERLAAGLGDLATGVTTVLRALSGWGGHAAEESAARATSEGDEYWENLRRKAAEAARSYGRPSAAGAAPSSADDDPWRTATAEPPTAATQEPTAAESAATESPAPEAADAPEPPVTRVPRPAKASRRAAAATQETTSTAAPAKAPVAQKTVAQKTVAQKAVAKKAVAKKATKPAAPTTVAAARAAGARKAVTKTVRPGGAA